MPRQPYKISGHHADSRRLGLTTVTATSSTAGSMSACGQRRSASLTSLPISSPAPCQMRGTWRGRSIRKPYRSGVPSQKASFFESKTSRSDQNRSRPRRLWLHLRRARRTTFFILSHRAPTFSWLIEGRSIVGKVDATKKKQTTGEEKKGKRTRIKKKKRGSAPMAAMPPVEQALHAWAISILRWPTPHHIAVVEATAK